MSSRSVIRKGVISYRASGVITGVLFKDLIGEEVAGGELKILGRKELVKEAG